MESVFTELQVTMLKVREKVVFKCTMAELILLITIFLVNGYQVKALSLMQGQEATLHFPYPCDSTEVTLQQSNRIPFYRSTDGSSLSLSQDQVKRFKIQNINNTDICSLEFTISNLQSVDQGTYICIVYKDGEILLKPTHRIWLQVDYPPGKASCVVSEGKGGDWVSIDCSANVVSLSGKIECYQGGVWMPPLTDPTETDTLLKQTILIRKSQPVFCCFSNLTEYKERCECDDTALYLDDTISSDPCSHTSTKTSTTSTYRTLDLVEKSESSDYPLLPSHTTSTNANKLTKSMLIPIIIYYIGLAGLIMIFIGKAIYFYQLRQERKNNSNDESRNLKAIIIYYISGTSFVILLILNTISVYQIWPENKNNSNDDESHNLEAIFIHVYYISAIGVVILSFVNSISLGQIDQSMQKRKQTSNGESQDPSLSRNVNYHCVQQCETDKLNKMMMQKLETHKTQNII